MLRAMRNRPSVAWKTTFAVRTRPQFGAKFEVQARDEAAIVPSPFHLFLPSLATLRFNITRAEFLHCPLTETLCLKSSTFSSRCPSATKYLFNYLTDSRSHNTLIYDRENELYVRTKLLDGRDQG